MKLIFPNGDKPHVQKPNDYDFIKFPYLILTAPYYGLVVSTLTVKNGKVKTTYPWTRGGMGLHVRSFGCHNVMQIQSGQMKSKKRYPMRSLDLTRWDKVLSWIALFFVCFKYISHCPTRRLLTCTFMSKIQSSY